MEIAILDASSGSVSLHTVPQSVKTNQDVEDYVRLELELGSEAEYIGAEEVILTDFRAKKGL